MEPRPESRPRGTLIAIGGHEDKEGDMLILRRVVECVGQRKLVIATIGSSEPESMWDDYRTVFHELGLKDLVHLDVDNRTEALDRNTVDAVAGAGGVFFTGGDQLKITAKLGGTQLCEHIHQIYAKGGVIAGTSAGASILTETMIVSGESDQTHRLRSSLLLAPGLGFLPAMVIDQHFAERGRLARLLGVVAQNPRALGIGIDENTAIEIREEREFVVLGKGAVYVLDGKPITHTNVSEEQEKTLSAFDVRLHVLSQGDCLDLESRRAASGLAGDIDGTLSEETSARE